MPRRNRKPLPHPIRHFSPRIQSTTFPLHTIGRYNPGIVQDVLSLILYVRLGLTVFQLVFGTDVCTAGIKYKIAAHGSQYPNST